MIKGWKRKGLIVGISNYASLQTLEFCKNDGEEVYETLSSLGYEISENNKLTGEVKGEKVKDAIYDFFGDINNNPDDTLLFYYSGHGVPDVDGDTYLASSDINPDEPGRRGFSFDELTKMIQKSVSTRVVAILDCCYSGAAKVSKGHADDAAKLGRIAIDEKLRKLPQGQGKYILSASQAAQEAYALSTSDHSIFTYYLLQGLKGNTESVDSEGNVTPQSLGSYVYRTIMSLPADKRPKQTPITKAEESGNVILAYHPELKPLKIEDTLASMLKLLGEGKVEEFNRMREQNPSVSLDFSRENLHRVHIVGANLSSANLNRTNFTQADLEGADLHNANLFTADLEGANLSKANLSKAVLEAANLSNANLTKANLSNTNLTRANLSYANIYSADLQQANLMGADLRGINITDANLIGADLRGSIFEERSREATPSSKPLTTTPSSPITTPSSKPLTTTPSSPISTPSDTKKKDINSVANSSGAPLTDVHPPSSPAKERKKYYRLLMPIIGAAVVGIIIVLVSTNVLHSGNGYSFITKWEVSVPSGVAVDSSGNVYVVDTGKNRVQKFNSIGTFITVWGSYGTANGQFGNTGGIAVDSSGNVYVADASNARVQKFNSIGTFITKWGSNGTADGQFRNPGDVAVDSSGNVYVADASNARVQKFNSIGTFITKWGSGGTADGQFQVPRAVAVHSSGNVYVTDSLNNRVQKFSSDGTFITKWGSGGTADGQFQDPSGVAVDSSGNVYVADTGNGRVQVFHLTK